MVDVKRRGFEGHAKKAEGNSTEHKPGGALSFSGTLAILLCSMDTLKRVFCSLIQCCKYCFLFPQDQGITAAGELLMAFAYENTQK